MGWQRIGEQLLLHPWIIVAIAAIAAAVIAVVWVIRGAVDSIREDKRRRGHYDEIAQADIRALEARDRAQNRWIKNVEWERDEQIRINHGARSLLGEGMAARSFERVEDELDIDVLRRAR